MEPGGSAVRGQTGVERRQAGLIAGRDRRIRYGAGASVVAMHAVHSGTHVRIRSEGHAALGRKSFPEDAADHLIAPSEETCGQRGFTKGPSVL